jgi:hypothetical protein
MQTQTEIPPVNEKENVALISYPLPAEVSTKIIGHLHLTIQEEEEDAMKKKWTRTWMRRIRKAYASILRQNVPSCMSQYPLLDENPLQKDLVRDPFR